LGYFVSLKCTGCGGEYGQSDILYLCPSCGSPLFANYDFERLRVKLGQREIVTRSLLSIWRYFSFLPVNPANIVSLGEGFTPLLKASRISERVGVKDLLLKNDFLSPSGSFKDRGSTVLISKAKELKIESVAIDSSGNAAASLAAYSAAAGLKCHAFVSKSINASKLVQLEAYGADVLLCEGTRKHISDITKEACESSGWYWCSFSVNPFALEGMKTIAYEVCEQTGWNLPDKIVFPVGSGSGLLGCWKGFKEIQEMGWIDKIPSIVCIQPEGCAPIADAHKRSSFDIVPVKEPKTIAEGLRVGHPILGRNVLKVLHESNGIAETVTDGQILEWGSKLARLEGLFVEPSAAVVIAGLAKLVENGQIEGDDRVTCVLTGTGLK